MLAGCPFWRGGLYLEDAIDIDENPIDNDIAMPLDPLNPCTFSAAKKRVMQQLADHYRGTMAVLAQENIDARSTHRSEIVARMAERFVNGHMSPKAAWHVRVEITKAVHACFDLMLELDACMGR
jgi:hypothetical protein